MATHCRLCGKPVQISDVHTPGSPNYVISCRRCGVYEADDGAWAMFKNIETDPADRHLLSALTRTAPIRGVGRVLIDVSSYVALREGRIREPTFAERRQALLDWIAFESRKDRKSPYGARVPFDPQQDYPVAYCHPLDDGNADEWHFIFRPLEKEGLIDSPENGKIRITEKAWELLETRSKASGSIGFIAMKFKGMDDLHKAIEDGIARAGYKPSRIDREEYIGGVMDQIIAKIRESRFVVADFTGERNGGVYYEAGFAFGLNLPTFMICRSDHLDGDNRVHFDVQHLNLLVWEEGKLAALSERLEARIVAVLGRGPLPVTSRS